ncbi:T9SS type B sorting domain-containing protein [Psychroflexus salis]|uniref:Ig-like domain-containing protein n=1 Tax=Psychroflexus salis TaxID=1526574 RepID=A0A917E6E9_9FLAO|nr:T9SS type B sorting domain-containing protein [Psychroflexus salis]GGE07652.1 hypothetical protein GCM10010831_06520 [Psychroflexus salis]
MLNQFFKTVFVTVLFCFAASKNIQAQINFCPGNTGDPIFEEDFGQGASNGPSLGNDITSYTYVNQAPNDGQYTISSNLMQLDGFHNISDHTGNTNGKALIVNADFDAGLFFQIPIDGLCENNSYEFSAFLVNLYNASTNFCPGTGIPVNVRFQIWDETDTELLAEGDSGNIEGSFNSPTWQQYAVTFETLPGQTSVILKMLNNGDGGCGNDLAIDDIVFRSCGDLTEIFDDDEDSNISFCENETLDNLTLNAVPDFSVYDEHFYQWQQSADNENWENISGETSGTLALNNIEETQFFRVLVAEDLINVNNTLCNSVSNVFEIIQQDFIDAESLGNVEVCEGEEAILLIQNNNNIQIDWYDSPTGGNLLLENSFDFEPQSEGTYYAESITINGNCINPNRVAVSLSINERPENEPVFYEICPGETVILASETEEVSYLWSTGETTSQIEVSNEGTYSVEQTTINGCSTTKFFEVDVLEQALVQNISTDENDIVIDLANQGDFLFSLGGAAFQASPIFENVAGGQYQIFIKSSKCGTQAFTFLHIVIPSYFTPNGDGFNDVFRIAGDTYFSEFNIQIFNRFGKLLISGNRAPFIWDGTYNGKILPSQDYWYKININGEIKTGNISLIR